MSDDPVPVTLAGPVPVPVRVVTGFEPAALAALIEASKTSSAVPPPNNTQYVYAVLLMAIFGVVAVTAITILRPGQDNTGVISTIVGLLAPTTLSLLAFMKAQETHLSVNSRLDQFIKNAELASRMQGVIDGRAQGRIDADRRTDNLQQATDERTAAAKEGNS
jgi:hypothetical protein